MNEIPDQVEDLRYCVLDYSNQDDVDFFFIPLIFLDQFSRPAADISIAGYRITVPLDWSILIADKELGQIEIIELKHLNDREFEAFIYNPVAGYKPEFSEIIMENIYPDIVWNVPKLKRGHILAVPLCGTKNPPCVFFVKDIAKLPEGLDISKIV